MDAETVASSIRETFTGIETTEDADNLFFSYAPDPTLQMSGWTPFATLIVNDAYDTASRLNRPSVFRLNVGVNPDTYRKLFGQQPDFSRESQTVQIGHDFAALDRLMPHPTYASMSWVCVLSPSDETFRALEGLLEEAYRTAVRRYESRARREKVVKQR